MEGQRALAIIWSDKISTADPNLAMGVFIDCAVKTTMHTYYGKDVKAAIDRNKGNHMNFVNALFTAVHADEEWQYQFYRFANATMSFDPEKIHDRLLEAESDVQVFKEDLLSLMKLFFAFSDTDPQAMQYVNVEFEMWYHLSEKYTLTKDQLADVAWTYPYLALMVLRVYSAIERPIGMNMLWDYPHFRPELRFIGLLGVVPRYGKCGGFVKALLHHAVLQVMKAANLNTPPDAPKRTRSDILWELLGLGRVIYHTGVSETCTREEFFPCLDISETHMNAWTVIFNNQYPDFFDIHTKYFEQTE